MLGTKKRTPSLKSVETTQITVPTWDGLKSLAAPTVAQAATWTSEHAAQLAESAAPHLHKAAETAKPTVRKAREQARKQAIKASQEARKQAKKASEQAPPQLIQAADVAKLAAAGLAARGAAQMGPHLQAAREVAQDKAPQVQAFLNEMIDAAASKEKRELYASRAADAALVLKGEASIRRHRKGGFGKKLLVGLGIVALGTACAVVAQRVLAAKEDPWMRPEDDHGSSESASGGAYGSVYGTDTGDDLPLASESGTRSAADYRNLSSTDERPTVYTTESTGYNEDLEVGTSETTTTRFGDSR